MKKSKLILLAFLIIGAGVAHLAGCGEDSPTEPAPREENRPPIAPAIDTGAGAPAHNATEVSRTATLHWTCTDPDGDALTYDVKFGTAAAPPEVASGQAGMTHNPGPLAYETTYYWQVVAEDPDGETTASAVWSFTTLAETDETMSVPSAPTGPAVGNTGASLDYAAAGAVSSEGHSLHYRFDWGDGSYSDWSAMTTVAHAWSASGSYEVRARARCAVHNGVESDWSAALTVTVSDAVETITTPGPTQGPTEGTTITSMAYTTETLAESNLGHILQYRYDWGDGAYSNWVGSNSAMHVFTTAGVYEVRAQARCFDHNDVVSDWAASLTVTITEEAETAHRPRVTQYPEFLEVGEVFRFGLAGQRTDLNHWIELQLDFGDGTVSSWLTASGTPPSAGDDHAYAAAGTYEVRGRSRCADHPDIVSDWSDSQTVTVVSGEEVVTTPWIHSPAEGEARTIDLGEDIDIYCRDAESSHGHDLEFSFDLGDGTISPWSRSSGVNHTFATIGDFEVRARARCQDHPDIETNWSDPITITVLETVAYVTISGPETATNGVPVTFTVSETTTSEGHAVEYEFYVGTYPNGWSAGPQGWQAGREIDLTFDSSGRYYIRARARCATHPESVSPISNYIMVTSTRP